MAPPSASRAPMVPPLPILLPFLDVTMSPLLDRRFACAAGDGRPASIVPSGGASRGTDSWRHDRTCARRGTVGPARMSPSCHGRLRSTQVVSHRHSLRRRSDPRWFAEPDWRVLRHQSHRSPDWPRRARRLSVRPLAQSFRGPTRRQRRSPRPPSSRSRPGRRPAFLPTSPHRLVVTGGGVIHDMLCDGTREHAAVATAPRCSGPTSASLPGCD